MPLSKEIQRKLQCQYGLAIRATTPISGGDINEAYLVTLQDGSKLFAKTLQDAPVDMFSSEACGLKALSVGGHCMTPAVIGFDREYLLLEYIEQIPPKGSYWQEFGQRLAQLHSLPQTGFGFESDNYCGRTRQRNPAEKDGIHFFAEFRIGYQADLALEHGLIDARERNSLQRLIDRLPGLLPEQPASLIHGDLWSGNHLCRQDGLPVLIDPATHRGWAEAEIAMTRLFGGFDESFYSAYLEVNPLLPGWQDRLPLYNLYHLLNHLNLFGSSYHGRVMSIVRSYL